MKKVILMALLMATASTMQAAWYDALKNSCARVYAHQDAVIQPALSFAKKHPMVAASIGVLTAAVIAAVGIDCYRELRMTKEQKMLRTLLKAIDKDLNEIKYVGYPLSFDKALIQYEVEKFYGTYYYAMRPALNDILSSLEAFIKDVVRKNILCTDLYGVEEILSRLAQLKEEVIALQKKLSQKE